MQSGNKKCLYNETSVASFEALQVWLRRQYNGLQACDLAITMNGGEPLDAETFARLLPDTVRTLECKRLDNSIVSFKTFDSIKAYAKLDKPGEALRTFGDDFPEITDEDQFNHELTKVVDDLMDNIDAFGTVNITNESMTRDYITPILRSALRLANKQWLSKDKSFPDNSTPPIPATSPPRKQHVEPQFTKVGLAYERWIWGTRAYGSVDFLFHVHSFMLPIFDTRKLARKTHNCLYQAVAAMLVSREQLYQHYMAFPGADGEVIQQELDQIPSFGALSTGDRWRFVKYEMKPDSRTRELRGDITMSKEFTVVLDTDLLNKEYLSNQIKPILKMLCGALLYQLEGVDSLGKCVNAAHK